jgi:hypothetical protein
MQPEGILLKLMQAVKSYTERSSDLAVPWLKRTNPINGTHNDKKREAGKKK